MPIFQFIKNLLTPEEINGGERCPTYLYRWILLPTPWFKVYLHHFVGDDWSRDMHDHPKRFLSIGLVGGYTEETPGGSKHYRAPWIRTFPAEHIHRVRMNEFASCWTLVVVFSTVRQWGFWHEGVWMHWREYVKGRYSALADSMKTCS